jgi:YfiH family protein
VLQLGSLGAPGWAARFCFTDRTGGFSEPPFDGLNLSFAVGDAKAAVGANRAWLTAQLRPSGLSDAIWLRAEHGANVITVASPDDALADHRADAFVTARPGLGLGALAADCALVVLADPVAGVVGVVHCGRPGLVAGVVAAAVASLRAIGGHRLLAAVGPTVCARCYELPLELADAVVAAVPGAGVTGRRHVDIRAGVVAQLRDEGVEVAALVGGCTREDGSLFSYRRDATTGRHGALVWMQP